MTTLFIAFLVFTFLTAIVTIMVYNKLSIKKNLIRNAELSLDTLLTKRNDLKRNLIEIIKKYITFENGTLWEIKKISPIAHDEYFQDNASSKLMKNLLMNIENYPELKSNTQFANLHNSYKDCEVKIAEGRFLLGKSIDDYNNQFVVFPAILIAEVFGFKAYQREFGSQGTMQNVVAERIFN